MGEVPCAYGIDFPIVYCHFPIHFLQLVHFHWVKMNHRRTWLLIVLVTYSKCLGLVNTLKDAREKTSPNRNSLHTWNWTKCQEESIPNYVLFTFINLCTFPSPQLYIATLFVMKYLTIKNISLSIDTKCKPSLCTLINSLIPII